MMFRSLFFRLGSSVGPSAAVLAVAGVLATATVACSSESSNANNDDNSADASVDSTADGGVDVNNGQKDSAVPDQEAGKPEPTCHNSQCKPGNICVGGNCALKCKSHSDCPLGYKCDHATADEDGSDVTVCKKVDYPHGKGEFFYPCPNHDECNEDAGFVCIGPKDDPDAICTRWDCNSDDDCPPSMYCGVGRVFREICDDPDFKPLLEPDEKCITKAEMTADGKTFRKGPISLLRNLCLPRGYCAPCNDDLDCSGSMYSVCVKLDGKGPGYCSKPCQPDAFECPWQGLSECKTVGNRGNMCVPRPGACTGDGSVCSPCRNDLDCWKPGDPHRKACLRSSMSREPYCIDFDQECSKDEECPMTPGGDRMKCITDYRAKDSPLYKRCYPPDNGLINPGHASCWPNPHLPK